MIACNRCCSKLEYLNDICKCQNGIGIDVTSNYVDKTIFSISYSKNYEDTSYLNKYRDFVYLPLHFFQ